MTIRFHHLTMAAALASTLLAGCATYTPHAVRPGMSADEVVAAMGRPNARHAQPGGGSRLEYARGPAGLHTYMVDLDAQGRVVGWEQVLDEAHFNAINPGLSVQELQRRVGRPAQVRSGGFQPGQVWSYRFDNWRCTWWQVSVVNGIVGDAAYTPDPRCQEPDDNDLR